MNGKELITSLQFIGADLIAQAEFEIPARRKRAARPLLIAALAAAMLLLVGCSIVYVLRMQDFKVGERVNSMPIYDESYQVQGYNDVTQNILTLSGLKGSNKYKAAAEWYDFMQAFDPNNDLQNEYYNSPNPQKFPAAYDGYQVYSQKMVDKIDELSSKYHLNLQGPLTRYQYESDFLAGTGVNTLLSKTSAVTLEFHNGYRYETGNWGCIFDMVPIESSGNWPPFMYGIFKYFNKANLDTEFWVVSQVNDEDTWNCTTPSGRTLLVIVEHEQMGVSVFCDRDDATILLSFSSLQKPIGDVESQELTRSQIEQIIQSFDFDILL